MARDATAPSRRTAPHPAPQPAQPHAGHRRLGSGQWHPLKPPSLPPAAWFGDRPPRGIARGGVAKPLVDQPARRQAYARNPARSHHPASVAPAIGPNPKTDRPRPNPPTPVIPAKAGIHNLRRSGRLDSRASGATTPASCAPDDHSARHHSPKPLTGDPPRTAASTASPTTPPPRERAGASRPATKSAASRVVRRPPAPRHRARGRSETVARSTGTSSGPGW